MYRPYARRLSRTKNVRVSDGDPSRNQSHPNEDDKPPGRWFLRSSSHLAILPLNTLRHYGRYIRSSSLGPSSCPYSPERVEGEFCELRLSRVLGSSHPSIMRSPVPMRQEFLCREPKVRSPTY